ncbi:probable LRR receptor-like serine/threonine-protein kinase At3g47570 [Eucalyptus grandis]|uniref:probable LRR receptor-like serine/threonine-protein kinase At3g47570 n=1 Tax=Eucalyptus grandis TaxID=71139 RepID=UPI00192ED4F1|nr:probable LRR receptor-like serine/threonine-protein kinase At3g47570 [Eucalyptus grandis]
MSPQTHKVLVLSTNHHPPPSDAAQPKPMPNVAIELVDYCDMPIGIPSEKLGATDGFSSSNLIGVGGFGSVYKGVLDENGTVIAVKVLNLMLHGAAKGFITECEALRNIRHRNLLKVLTVCSGTDYSGNEFKALVYEFMVNGSLEDWLHPSPSPTNVDGNVQKLSLIQRIDISIDVASALDYLHNNLQSPVIHCDLKPSNILLDAEMVGHVGDFGLAKITIESPDDSKASMRSVGVRGTIGYAAPGKSCVLFPSASTGSTIIIYLLFAI